MRLNKLFAALGLFIVATRAFAQAPDRQDVSTMAPGEIETLQRRLTDAGCYAGSFDGKPSEATRNAVNSCPDQRPQLRIETRMHLAVIRRVGVDAQCKIAATGSNDKTVRLWSLPDGALLRTLRLPIGIGSGAWSIRPLYRRTGASSRPVDLTPSPRFLIRTALRAR